MCTGLIFAGYISFTASLIQAFGDDIVPNELRCKFIGAQYSKGPTYLPDSIDIVWYGDYFIDKYYMLFLRIHCLLNDKWVKVTGWLEYRSDSTNKRYCIADKDADNWQFLFKSGHKYLFEILGYVNKDNHCDYILQEYKVLGSDLGKPYHYQLRIKPKNKIKRIERCRKKMKVKLHDSILPTDIDEYDIIVECNEVEKGLGLLMDLTYGEGSAAREGAKDDKPFRL